MIVYVVHEYHSGQAFTKLSSKLYIHFAMGIHRVFKIHWKWSVFGYAYISGNFLDKKIP